MMQRTSAPVVATCLLLGACSGDVSKLAATGTGDVSNPPALRIQAGAGSPQCDDARLTMARSLTVDLAERHLNRSPYLQKVTSNSAAVLFTTDISNPSVDLVSPTGEVLRSIDAAVDPSGANEDQWIASFEQLEPSSWYCYAPRGMAELTAFRTAPLGGTHSPVRFIVFGDSGNGEFQQAVRDQMETVSFDLILHTGDIAYDDGTRGQLERYFFDVYAPLLRSAPVFPITGNHDYRTAGAAPFREMFALPENGNPNGSERWYSFDWGDVHFVALDTEQPLAEQTVWLVDDLENNHLPWTFAYLHRPPYSSGEHGSNQRVRRAFSPIFAQYGVQLVFAGHDHDYERTRPIDGVTYVVTGAGGRGTRSVGRSSFTEYSEDVLHFVYVEVDGDRAVLHAIDGVGREFDSARIEVTRS